MSQQTTDDNLSTILNLQKTKKKESETKNIYIFGGFLHGDTRKQIRIEAVYS